MYATPATGRGAVIASLAAGPVFVLAITLTSLPVRTEDLDGFGAGLSVLGGVGLIAIPFGFVFSIVPNLVGARVLATLGQDNDAVRLPVVWTVVGALAAGLFAWAIRPMHGATGLIAAFATTGAACALICRRFTRWP